jgi:hypothetical protein
MIGKCDYSYHMSPATGSEAVTAERCPVCRARLVVRTPGEVLIRNAILRVDAPTGGVTAKCPRCKAWVGVPLLFVG